MDDFRFAGVIDNSLWDVAGWSGVSWLIPPSETRHPPGIGLVFKDAESGARIFRALRDRFTVRDEHDVVRVTVITGTHPIHGVGCSIYIGTDLDGLARQDYADANLVLKPNVHITSTFIFHSSPSSDPRIETFRRERRKYGDAYFLAPCYPEAGEAVPQFDLLLGKRRISFRDFADITPNEPENVALLG